MKMETIVTIYTVCILVATSFAILFAEISNLRQEIDTIELIKGDIGERGDTGLAGINGTDGVNGTNGINGTDGARGQRGRTGASGTDGHDGTNGFNGTDGANGLDADSLIPCAIIGSNEVLFEYDGDFYAYFAVSPNALKSMLSKLDENRWFQTGDGVVFKILNSTIVYL